VLRGGITISGHGSAGEDAAMNHRVQRFDAAVHHFRKPGDAADRNDRKTALFQHARGTSGRHELESTYRKSARELEHTGSCPTRLTAL
jgi:hypothetical protein